MNKVFLIGTMTAAALVAVFWSLPPSPPQPGYFKDTSNNRVVSYVTPDPLDSDQARAILDSAPFTAGRVTVAVLYTDPTTAPGDILTLADDLPAAMRLVADGWAWRLRRAPSGQVTFDTAGG